MAMFGNNELGSVLPEVSLNRVWILLQRINLQETITNNPGHLINCQSFCNLLATQPTLEGYQKDIQKQYIMEMKRQCDIREDLRQDDMESGRNACDPTTLNGWKQDLYDLKGNLITEPMQYECAIVKKEKSRMLKIAKKILYK